jgi:hypothetical protein
MIKRLKTLLTSATVVATLPFAGAVIATGSSGCTSDDAACTADCSADCPASCPPPAGDLQTPPQGSDAVISAWITAGSYKGAGWRCEAAVHDARSPSPHGKNKICNNTKLSSTAAPAKYPFGAASVKELYAADGTTIAGYAIALKLVDGDSVGPNWYFYETMGGAVVYNGKGLANNADVCSGCHAGAGSDAMHSGRDFVYTQVP